MDKSDSKKETISTCKSILVVEDTPIQAKKLLFYLKKWGYRTHWAKDGVEALESLESEVPDLVISDVQMPNMDGLQLLHEIRKESRHQELPIVMTTTLQDDETIAKALSLEADDFIVKPYNTTELRLRIGNLFEKIEAQNQVKLQVQAMDSAIDGIAILDGSGRYTYSNQAHVKDFGFFQKSEIMGKKWELLYPAESLEKINYKILPEVKKSGSWRGEVIAKKVDGEIYTQELSIRLLEDGSFSFICRDITEQITRQRELEALNLQLVRAEKVAQNASRLKGEFLANMSHEIRTPLNGILGIVELLAETPLNKEQQDYLQLFKQSGQDLLRIVNDILDLSKIEADCLELEHRPFKFAGSLKQSLESMKGLFLRKNLEYSIDIRKHVPEVVVGDKTRIIQVILNLLNNALKFTEKGKVTVEIDALPDGGDGEQLVQFSIIDTGPGLTEEQLSRIFARFQQADSSTTRKHGGTGLGLNICQRLTGLMNGTINVTSKVGEGTTFIVELPLKTAGQDELQQFEEDLNEHDSAEPNPSPISGEISLLVVEDNQVNRNIIGGFLRSKKGIKITYAENGLAGVNLFKAENFDLVLMDIQMPVMDGLTAVKIIRDHESSTEIDRTPIAALSAAVFEKDKKIATESGFDLFLTKPIRKKDLHAAIDRLLKLVIPTRKAG